MTAPAGGLMTEMVGRMRKSLFPAGKTYDSNGVGKKGKSVRDQLDELGIFGVDRQSDDETIAEWETKLWEDQDTLIEDLEKEWRQHLYYKSGQHFIAYHRDRRQWIPKRTQPWRIRSQYNVVRKAVNLRVGRLTENKPTVSAVAKRPDAQTVDKTEYKEMAFWHVWDVAQVHDKLVRARRWATICGKGYLIVGWDADAGPPQPATMKFPRYEKGPDPSGAIDPLTLQPKGVDILAGFDEMYVDAKKQPLGPVETLEPDETDPSKEPRKVRHDPPDGTVFLHEGEVDIEHDSSFNLRWDRYTDAIHDSWYVQRATIKRASAILAMKPDYAEILKKATPASEEQLQNQFQGLTTPNTQVDIGGPMHHRDEQGARQPGSGKVDEPYVVRETWIWPKNDFLRRQWGPKGCKITTIGGEFCHKADLPPWALDAPNFIELPDEPEEGNHYSCSIIRDLLPLQDDINRSRSHKAERVALASRLILTAIKGGNLNFRMLGGMPAALLEVKSQEYVPTPLNLSASDGGENDEFYQSSLQAASDVGHMQDATIGKLPSAGLAAKAIYALQYADERNITEVSNAQDMALVRLANAIDAVTRHEYIEKRKIQISGSDYSFLAEAEILPEDLNVEVDYRFSPGSMLSRNKEAIKNEVLQLVEIGFIDPLTARKALSVAVPEAFRQAYDAQVASAKRRVYGIRRGKQSAVMPPEPWENPDVHVAVIEETLLSQNFKDFWPPDAQAVLKQLWQAYQAVRTQRMMEQQRLQAPKAPPEQPGEVGPAKEQQSGPKNLEARATESQQPSGGAPPGQPL